MAQRAPSGRRRSPGRARAGGRDEDQAAGKDAITKPLTGFGLPVRPYREDAGFALLEILVQRRDPQLAGAGLGLVRKSRTYRFTKSGFSCWTQWPESGMYFISNGPVKSFSMP